jgi:hypothetical protein
MKFRTVYPFLALAALILIVGLACGTTSTATDSPANPVTTPSNTPPPPTNTPAPTATITPTPGPIVVDDDFSTDTGRFECGLCEVTGGELHIGPYPSQDSYEAFFAICEDCGTPSNFKLSFDARYASGYADRGFGAILRENNGSFIDLEITTWLVYGVWHYDASLSNSAWAWDTAYTAGWVQGGLKGGSQTNHVEAVVQGDQLRISINGVDRLVTIPSGQGRVGLMVGMHSLEIAFDNFHFEELRP